METSDSQETTLLISRPGIPTAIRDNRESYEKQLALYLILASTLLERLAFYSLSNNLISNLQSNKTVAWSYEHSSTTSFIFSGTRYISTLIFAALSDAKLGRTRTIIIGFILYLIGYTLVTITSHEAISSAHFCNMNPHNITSILDEPCAPWILSTLICIAIGAGTVQANIAVFGAEQIRKLKSISEYSDKYVIALNVGAMLTIFAVPYIEEKGANYYFITYLVAEFLLLSSILLFAIGCRYCIHVTPYDTVITNCIPVIINACQSWYRHRINKRLINKKNINSSSIHLRSISYKSNEIEESTHMDEPIPTFLDHAKAAHYGKFQDRVVDDVNSLWHGIIAFSLLIPYWLIYNQINSTFLQQGEKMKLPYDGMPVTWMTLGDPITIIIGIFILDTFMYKYLNAWNKETIIITKFVIGMCFASLTMCTAGVIEVFRQKNCIGNDKSSLSVYFQIPQNILMGFSELFATVASYEFAYYAAPRSAQTLFMSLHFCTVGLSSFIDMEYSNAFLKPAYDDPTSNCLGYKESWRYYTYYYILAAVQLVFIFIFIICDKKFRIYKLNPQQMETTQFLRRLSRESNAK